jgi:hypothetical protein
MGKEGVRATLTNGWKRTAAAGYYWVDWLSLHLFVLPSIPEKRPQHQQSNVKATLLQIKS